jgi:hypothetical protein
MKRVKMKMSRDFSEELMSLLIKYHEKMWLENIKKNIAYNKSINIKQNEKNKNR